MTRTKRERIHQPHEPQYHRQENLVPHDVISQTDVAVIGLGAVGRPIVRQLLAMGIRSILACDPDTVEDTNVVTQGYSEADVGRQKASVIFDLDPTRVRAIPKFFHKSMLMRQSIVFSCVDTMSGRKEIAKGLPRKAQLIDCRVGGNTIRIFTAPNWTAYKKTWFPDSEAREEACSTASTIYAGHLTASLAVAHFARWLKGFPLPNRISVDLTTDLYEIEHNHAEIPNNNPGEDS